MLSIQACVCETELSASAGIVSNITVLLELQVGRYDFLNTTSLITWYYVDLDSMCVGMREKTTHLTEWCALSKFQVPFLYILIRIEKSAFIILIY